MVRQIALQQLTQHILPPICHNLSGVQLPKLAQQIVREVAQQERLAVFAEASIPTVADLLASGLETQPLLIQEGASWTACVWCFSPAQPGLGFSVRVKRQCRTRRLALLVANYFRLHTVINQFQNLNDSFSPNSH